MDTIAIPDIHNKIDLVDSVLYSIKTRPLRVVYLGDYWDDYNDGPGDAQRVAQWLADKIDHPAPGLDETFLLGNHDMPYLFPETEKQTACSGFAAAKATVVRACLNDPHYRETMRLGAMVGGWLLTHAGITHSWLKGQTAPLKAAIDTIAAVESAINSGKFHPWVGAGADRGGSQPLGGLTWCDWNSFRPTAGLKQLVGHTQGISVRHKGENHCIDTRLRHYAAYLPDSDSWEFRSTAL